LSQFEKIGIVIRYEFLKHIRRARLYVILGIALLGELAVLILIPVLRDGYPQSMKVMAAMLTVGPSLAALGAVFFAGDAVAGEFEGKTGFLLFTNPIKRYILWVGKYIAGFIAVTLLIIFAYIIIAISLLVIYQDIPFEILKSFGLCLLFASAMLSVTFLFSSVSKGSMGATVMTLVFVWVICGIIESVLAFTGNPYWFILSAGGDSITMAYGGMELFTESLGMARFEAMMEGFKPMDLGLTAWGMAIYLVVGLVASVMIGNRRQLA
jgi:ABC-2 type transport system permease protein